MGTIQRVPGVVEAQFDEVRVVLNDDLEYLGLDEVGQRIWDLLERPATLEDLVATLTAEYDVSDADCARDVDSFLGALERHHLVTRR
ncbi:MAG: PqqD family peptide modification chaperone [Nocardioidaceae bacterium]|nr:PqqD family peptide modification chaperone [Nocardioidaceae bacterium]MCL2614522.1 PqqD family peptide modification chaperone [Nocardioidaceae bacterium]